MAVRIRLTRLGRTNHAFFRIGVYDSKTARDGKCLENLGWYDPHGKTPEKTLSIDLARTAYWMSVGALPTPKTATLLKKAGVKPPQAVKTA